MTKYIYKGEEISHTRFITICQMAGIMGGRKKSHYEKLVEMAEQGNERAQAILNDLEVVEPYTMQSLADYINESEDWPLDVEDIIEENGWVSDCGTEFGVCHNETDKVVMNDAGVAIVVRRRGGHRPGAGRPFTERNVPLLVRITQEAADKLARLTDNKSEYIDNLIKQQPE